jgi:N6-L-threonylcarbamoyladenine synthase
VSFAIAEVLVKKLKRAIKKTGVETVVLAGGVSANSMLREKAEKMAKETGVQLFSPKISYCTDNAAMIAITGKMKADLGQFDDLDMVPYASI